MAINKIPKNYYSDTNIRRDKINEIIDEVNDIASIPSPTEADAGKVVKVSEEGSYELANVPSELPTVTSADAGKVLGVDSNGAWELVNDVVTIEFDDSLNGFVLSKNIEEVINIINNGHMLDFVNSDNNRYAVSAITSTEMKVVHIEIQVSGSTRNVYFHQITFNRSTGIGKAVYKII